MTNKNEMAIWNPNMNGGEWEIFEEDMITYTTTDHMGMMRIYMEDIFAVEEVAEMGDNEILEFMEGEAREWRCLEDEIETVEIANSIMAIQEGYRCEQEDVPAGILAWAMVKEDGNR